MDNLAPLQPATKEAHQPCQQPKPALQLLQHLHHQLSTNHPFPSHRQSTSAYALAPQPAAAHGGSADPIY
ncbi:hypothetical protein V6N13_108144 [Hibiscus sabdariffa]